MELEGVAIEENIRVWNLEKSRFKSQEASKFKKIQDLRFTKIQTKYTVKSD